MMISGFGKFWRLMLLLLPTFAIAAAAGAQTAPNAATAETPRFLVYFDEFSANRSDEAKKVIADAAKRARESAGKAMAAPPRALAPRTAQTTHDVAETDARA